MATGIKELLASGGRVIVAIEPIRNLLVIPPFFTETLNGVKQELLILRIGCNPEIGKSFLYGECEVNISRVILRYFLPPKGSIPQSPTLPGCVAYRRLCP